MGKLLGLILRFLFSWIDGITVRLITTIYRLFSDMTELVVYNDSIIKTIGKRIGLILGIFMLFKLAISLISYMISPDKLSDGKQGGGKLIINVGISLALLISINFIFKEAYFVQGKLVESRIIEKIFFGESGVILKSNNENLSGSQKMNIGYYLYTGFFNPNTDVFDVTCNDMWDVSKKISDECNSLLEGKFDNEEVNEIYRARNSLDMSYVFFNHGLVLAQPDNDYTYAFDYTPIISNAAGIIVLLVLISFSMDLATRAIKLFFLQVIAPIPIISNMDMGKGQDIFKKWGKECINTYLQVFMRLIAINFAVFMIVLLRGNYKEVFVNNIWLNIFLIIGCLMFAKQVPKLLEDFFGIKSDGMTLNPLKKFEEQAMFGKNITGLAAGAAVGTMGALTGAGVLQGFKGAWSGMTGGKGFKEAWKGQVSKNATSRTALLNGSTLPGRIGARLGDLLGTGGELALIEREKDVIATKQKKYDDQIKDIEDKKKGIEKEIAPIRQQIAEQKSASEAIKALEERAKTEIEAGHGGAIGREYLRRKAEYEKYKADSTKTAAEIAQAESKMIDWLNDQGMKQYMSDAIYGVIDDASFTNMYQSAVQKAQRAGIELSDDGEEIHRQFGQTKGNIGTYERQIYSQEQQISDFDREITTISGQRAALNDEMRAIEKRESIANANKSAIGK